jgi:thiosulfate/3-mercaptopyruvate sulfurtransferase
LLIEPGALAEVGEPRHVILDAREGRAWSLGHVPGAVQIDAADWAKAFGDGADAEGWSKRIGDLGITADTPVVVYDDSLSRDAARIWWILKYWGVNRAAILNGGWAGWKASGLPISDKATAAPAPVTFQATAGRGRLATKATLLEDLTSKSRQIVDTRSFGEFCGDRKLSNHRGGAMPGAVHLEWSDLMDSGTQRFKTADELSRLFQMAGIDAERPLATHCQSGGRSSVTAFVLELMGADDVQNYYRGWSEWGNAEDTPIVIPPRN